MSSRLRVRVPVGVFELVCSILRCPFAVFICCVFIWCGIGVQGIQSEYRASSRLPITRESIQSKREFEQRG